MQKGLFSALLQLADDHLVLGHRLSEWCGHAPMLEEDLALPNIALDLIGQARKAFSGAKLLSRAGLSFIETDRYLRRSHMTHMGCLSLCFGDPAAPASSSLPAPKPAAPPSFNVVEPRDAPPRAAAHQRPRRLRCEPREAPHPARDAAPRGTHARRRHPVFRKRSPRAPSGRARRAAGCASAVAVRGPSAHRASSTGY